MLIEKWCNIDLYDYTVTFKEQFNKYLFNNIITCNLKMLEQIKLIEKVAKSNVSVIISGETGCGKELFAEYIHNKSSRFKDSFIKINCATISETLFESEMFGYSPGSFTGALKSGKKGIFEISNNGTLFLDEVSEMSKLLQSKFLRVIQEKCFIKVGGFEEINVDVRIIVATNKNLRDMVDTNMFREDLYYRLNTIPIYILPLRERAEDIILLSLFFLNKYNDKYLVHKKMSKNLLNTFIDYNWPGNVRELKHTMERLVLLSNMDVIDKTDFIDCNFNISKEKNLEEITYDNLINMNDLYESEIRGDKSLKEMVTDFEIRIIKDCIKRHGSIRKASKILKVSPSTISRKLSLYNI